MEKKETDPNKLLWLDMEMSGLDPEVNKILEIAVILTDKDLNVIEEGPELVIHQDEKTINSMDSWNTQQHSKTGLTQKVRESKVQESDAEKLILNFIRKYSEPHTLVLCGNSVHQDRRFLVTHMPNLNEYLHYRILDVSSIKELAKRWYPDLKNFEKEDSHRALEDIKESIRELNYYRNNIFR